MFFVLLLRHFDICSVSFPTFGHVFVVPQSYPVRVFAVKSFTYILRSMYIQQAVYVPRLLCDEFGFLAYLALVHLSSTSIHTQVVSDHRILRRVGMIIHTRRARHCLLACWVSGCTTNIYILSPSLGTSTRHGNTAHTYFTTYL